MDLDIDIKVMIFFHGAFCLSAVFDMISYAISVYVAVKSM